MFATWLLHLFECNLSTVIFCGFVCPYIQSWVSSSIHLYWSKWCLFFFSSLDSNKLFCAASGQLFYFLLFFILLFFKCLFTFLVFPIFFLCFYSFFSSFRFLWFHLSCHVFKSSVVSAQPCFPSHVKCFAYGTFSPNSITSFMQQNISWGFII